MTRARILGNDIPAALLRQLEQRGIVSTSAPDAAELEITVTHCERTAVRADIAALMDEQAAGSHLDVFIAADVLPEPPPVASVQPKPVSTSEISHRPEEHFVEEPRFSAVQAPVAEVVSVPSGTQEPLKAPVQEEAAPTEPGVSTLAALLAVLVAALATLGEAAQTIWVPLLDTLRKLADRTLRSAQHAKSQTAAQLPVWREMGTRGAANLRQSAARSGDRLSAWGQRRATQLNDLRASLAAKRASARSAGVVESSKVAAPVDAALVGFRRRSPWGVNRTALYQWGAPAVVILMLLIAAAYWPARTTTMTQAEPGKLKEALLPAIAEKTSVQAAAPAPKLPASSPRSGHIPRIAHEDSDEPDVVIRHYSTTPPAPKRTADGVKHISDE